MLRKVCELDAAGYRALVHSAPDAIVVVDSTGHIVLANEQALKLFGYSPGELEGRFVEVLVPQAYRFQHRTDRADYARHPETRLMESRGELRGHRKDGSDFPAEIGLSSIRTAGGPVVCCIVRNSQRAEQALRESELRYRRLFETSTDGILILDGSTGQIADANPALIQLFGYSREELLGRPIGQAEPFCSIETSQATFEDLSRLQFARYPEVTFRAKDGRTIFAEFVSNAFVVDGNRVIQCNLRDIGERKRAEDTLRQREEWYRELFEEDPAGNCVGTADGQLLACNAAFLRMFGFGSLDEAMQTGLLPLYPNPGTRERFMQRLKEEKILRHYEEELRRRDGTPLQVLKRAIGTFDARGELTTIHVQLIDESERLRREMQIHQAQKMEALGRLAGGVAHDFNNLLGVIIGQSELMAGQMDPASRPARQLHEIVKAAHSASSLTHQLLAYTRQQVLEPRVLDLNAIVTDASKMLRRILGEDIELVFRPGAEVGKVKADPNQLLQVILNLATNARDAMPSGGRLTIETANVDSETDGRSLRESSPAMPLVKLQVSDTGIGMSRETMAQIFEPFFTTKGPGKGTGLGLSTVCGIVQQSGGHIAVESEPGRGATFRIYLPRALDLPRREELSKKAPPRGTETILVVEDSPELRDIVRQFLEMNGYQVLLAGTCAQGERAAADHRGPIHLLLTDIVLPGGDNGRILAERLLNARPGLEVLFMSGYADDALLYHPEEKEELHFLPKPFTCFALLEKIRTVLNVRAQRDRRPT